MQQPVGSRVEVEGSSVSCFQLDSFAAANMSSAQEEEPTNVDQSEEQLVQEFLTVIDTSVQDCNSEVKVVLQSQKDLQKSLHRLGAEVQKIFQRLPRASIANRTSKIPALRKRCQRLGSKVKEVQVRHCCS